MASRIALLISSLVALASALVPPCMSELGPRFCPPVKPFVQPRELAVFPDVMRQETLLKDDVFARFNATRMKEQLLKFTNSTVFPNRHCKSKHGVKFKNLLEMIVMNDLKSPHGVLNGTSSFPSSFRTVLTDTPQQNFIFRILAPEPHGWYAPKDTIVVGAHMDSINQSPKKKNIDEMVAPGADDNGSGVVVLLEVLRALAPLFAEKNVVNEVQFHWYAAEEIGLHGSDSIFKQYQNQSWPVKAMLNLDMVGYRGNHGGERPTIAVQGDHIDENLKAFTKKLIKTYPNATAGDMACGYACSDHASAYKYGFPSAMIGESAYIHSQAGRPDGYPWIHSANDTIDHIDFEYMLEFAKVAAAFVVELAYTNFSTVAS